MLDITVQLNTNITNEISDARVVKAVEAAAPPSYQDGGIMLNGQTLSGDRVYHRRNGRGGHDFGDGELSDDGDAIEWTEIATTGINLDPCQHRRGGF